MANKERITEIKKQWRIANKDKVLEYHRRWQKENKEKIAEYKKQYRDAGTKTKTEVEQPKTVAPAKKERTEKKSYKETMKEIDYNIRYGEKLQLPKDFYDMWA